VRRPPALGSGGLLAAAIKISNRRLLGLEETAAATTALFLEGACPRPTGKRP
jgi:hypothetical protein